MDVIGGNGVIEHPQALALLDFKEPSHACLPVSGKLEQKLFLMAPVGNMPNVTRKIVSVGSRHRLSLAILKGTDLMPKRPP
jgi:hypothetical protein